MAAMHPAHNGHRRGAPHEIVAQILVYLHYAYPILLLSFFLFAIAVRSIRAASIDSDSDSSPSGPRFGPGGKPLPKRKPAGPAARLRSLQISRPRRLLFEWLIAAATLTFIANAVIVVFHVIYERRDKWWCGQSVVVSVCGLSDGLDHRDLPTPELL